MLTLAGMVAGLFGFWLMVVGGVGFRNDLALLAGLAVMVVGWGWVLVEDVWYAKREEQHERHGYKAR